MELLNDGVENTENTENTPDSSLIKEGETPEEFIARINAMPQEEINAEADKVIASGELGKIGLQHFLNLPQVIANEALRSQGLNPGCPCGRDDCASVPMKQMQGLRVLASMVNTLEEEAPDQANALIDRVIADFVALAQSEPEAVIHNLVVALVTLTDRGHNYERAYNQYRAATDEVFKKLGIDTSEPDA